MNYKPDASTPVDIRLVYLMEECAELTQACAKAVRWGLGSTNPELPSDQQETNRDWIRREIKDVQHAIFILEGALR